MLYNNLHQQVVMVQVVIQHGALPCNYFHYLAEASVWQVKTHLEFLV